ncbi:hypothetical protein BDV29DRAFT_172418, partial [Aspergillus leporis]|jgi:2-polyprenyl-6-methoxyphenol hydroxylase-like FAD-dependent oxidoreductase
LRNWDPSLPEHRWENQLGRVALAGNTAHPMTFQREQGLNHAIMDAYIVCKAIESFWGDLALENRARAFQEYEAEMIQQMGEEVRLSGANSVVVHDRSKINESPSLKRGMTVEAKIEAQSVC